MLHCRSGISLSDLHKLPVIHVSGTKGKGSTCAFCESILRNHGYKTGFFSSPHLIEVRERIRINGKPISQEMFSKYFWNILDNLNSHKVVIKCDFSRNYWKCCRKTMQIYLFIFNIYLSWQYMYFWRKKWMWL